jgi:mannose-6-phosphate isomerase-like protein (cupin superfamily)
MVGRMTKCAPSIPPIALTAGEGDHRWFLGQLATIKASSAATGGGATVIQQLCRPGSGSPLHVHRRDDEWFYILSGRVTFEVGDDEIDAPAGSFVFGPRDIPHRFTVEGPDDAAFLLVTQPGGFDEFLTEMSVPADGPVLPPAGVAMPDPAALGAAAARYGIEILGPPRNP